MHNLSETGPAAFRLVPAKYDPYALASATVLLAVVAAAFAYVVKPLPFSDWAYYWDAASGTASYERGGVLLFVLRAIQSLELDPYVAALAMNLPAAVVILVITYVADGRRIGIATALVLAYLLAITPYFSVVQFDLSATALLFAGFFLLVVRGSDKRRIGVTLLALVSVALAVSSRPQFLLILLFFGGTLALCSLATKRSFRQHQQSSAVIAVVLVAAAMLGFGIDSALRAHAGRAEAVRTNSAVTLYAGLLSSGVQRPSCGHWSATATRDARADADTPLVQAISQRLEQHSFKHWLSVVKCKVPVILLPPPYALSWSLGAPNVTERVNSAEDAVQLDRRTTRAYRIEHWGYRGLLLLIYSYAIVVVLQRARSKRWMAALIPLFWIASYWAVHSVFEIQARYFLSLFLALPFMATSGITSLFDRRYDRA